MTAPLATPIPHEHVVPASITRLMPLLWLLPLVNLRPSHNAAY
jgi:hypothetical protein